MCKSEWSYFMKELRNNNSTFDVENSNTGVLCGNSCFSLCRTNSIHVNYSKLQCNVRRNFITLPLQIQL